MKPRTNLQISPLHVIVFLVFFLRLITLIVSLSARYKFNTERTSAQVNANGNRQRHGYRGSPPRGRFAGVARVESPLLENAQERLPPLSRGTPCGGGYQRQRPPAQYPLARLTARLDLSSRLANARSQQVQRAREPGWGRQVACTQFIRESCLFSIHLYSLVL